MRGHYVGCYDEAAQERWAKGVNYGEPTREELALMARKAIAYEWMLGEFQKLSDQIVALRKNWTAASASADEALRQRDAALDQIEGKA